MLVTPTVLFAVACSDDDDDKIDPGTLDAGSRTKIDEDTGVKTANWPYDTVQFRIANNKDTIAVQLNKLPVQSFTGHDKTGAAFSVEGVGFSDIFDQAGIDASTYDQKAINCVARDHFDPLRSLLGCDTSKALTVGFFRQYGFIYNCTGKKEEGSPMDGKALCVNYALKDESQIPPNIGTKWTDISKQFWSKIETVDDAAMDPSYQGYGVIEIDPDLTNDAQCQGTPQ